MRTNSYCCREGYAVYALSIYFVLLFFLSAAPCFAEDTAKAEVNRLNEKYEKLANQGRYTEAIKYAEKLIPAGETAYGKEHPFVAIFQNNLAELYSKIGQYEKAESLYQQALVIAENGLGKNHPVVGLILNNLAQVYSRKNQFLKAKTNFQRSYDIFSQHFGSDHIQVAKSLHNIAGLHVKLGQYAKAEPMFKKSLAIMEKTLGPEHPTVATSLSNLASLYQSMGNYTEAESLFRRSLNIRQQVFGADHPNIATSYNQMADFYLSIGEHERAQEYYQRSLKIQQKAYGHQHPEVATTIASIAHVYQILGDYSEAENLYMRSLEIRLTALGPEHLDVAKNFNELGIVYYRLGDPEKAEELYTKALALKQKALGPHHPSVATILNNLAILYHSMGDYSKAGALSKQSLAIREKALGPEHPDVASNLEYLADLLQSQKDYDQALKLLQRSLSIRRKAYGPKHPQLAESLLHLAGHYYQVDNFSEAEALYKSALEIQEKVYGSDHLNVARNINNLALLYQRMGEFKRAEGLHQRSLSICQKRLGLEHQTVATCLSNLALDYAGMNDFKAAHLYNKRVQDIENKLIERLLGFTSERQKLNFLTMQNGDLYSYLSLVVKHLPDDKMARQDALDLWLKRKGIVLQVQKRYQEALIYSDNTRAAEIFQALSQVRAQLSKLSFTESGAKDAAGDTTKIKDLENQKEKLEAQLSKLSDTYAISRKIAGANRNKVAERLPESSVLLEFAKILLFDFHSTGTTQRWKSGHYITFILHAGDGNDVRIVDLGRSDRIDNEIVAFKKEIADAQHEKAMESVVASNRLYELIFRPLEKELDGAKDIFIAPDGNLSLLPFEVIKKTDGSYLIEDYTFNYLTSGRDLLGFDKNKAAKNKSLLIGDPDFNLAPADRIAIVRKLSINESLPLRAAIPDHDMKGFFFARLPGTQKEVLAINRILGEGSAEVFIGKKALEELLYHKDAPKILHLATHGFFLEDTKTSSRAGDDPLRGLLLFETQQTATRNQNPLTRSGIALAGANRARNVSEGPWADGIVTAEKILSLDLHGTEMVVLSACDTGLGKVQTGEGVFGLRRAFIQAGAQSLVMSMWSVPDKETKELMIRFYTNLASGTMNKCQALRQAALKQMSVVKTRYGNKNPLYWGAFVFLGES